MDDKLTNPDDQQDGRAKVNGYWGPFVMALTVVVAAVCLALFPTSANVAVGNATTTTICTGAKYQSMSPDERAALGFDGTVWRGIVKYTCPPNHDTVISTQSDTPLSNTSTGKPSGSQGSRPIITDGKILCYPAKD